MIEAVYTFSNVTLTSEDGDLSVVVFLPAGLKPEEDTFYYSSRFDHGSMIGSIRRTVRSVNSKGEKESKTHVLFEADMWRVPHNPYWPESGLGLASEFGAGDDGAFCFYRCGWSGANDVTNGVLGYGEAKNGESFLKIGVGELIKGSCPQCDSTDDYRFNSPYQFAKPPDWRILEMTDHSISLEHDAFINNHGYRLTKDVNLANHVLNVTSTLTNLGKTQFSTAWYSHNFFTCDHNAVGPGYSMDMDLKGDAFPLYDEPGTWSWSTPLAEYATVTSDPTSCQVQMKRTLHPGVRIKTEFINDGSTAGGFTIQACDMKIESSIPEIQTPSDSLSMYAYNLYIERATFSPEPQLLIHLTPGESTSWTQQLVITNQDEEPEESESPSVESQGWLSFSLRSMTANGNSDGMGSHLMVVGTAAVFVAAMTAVTLLRTVSRRRRRYRQYNIVPDLTA